MIIKNLANKAEAGFRVAFTMKQALYFGVLSLLLAGCSQFKISKSAALITPESEVVAAADEHPAGESTVTSENVSRMLNVSSRNLLLGKWYGIRQTAEGGQKEWLTERSADGTYRTDFRLISANGKIRSQSEVGFWGVSGETYFRIFRGWITLEGMKLADSSNADHYDAYRVQTLDKSYFIYQHASRGQKYTVKKMPADFHLPVTMKSQEDEPLTFSF
jgi:hypothetical protein